MKAVAFLPHALWLSVLLGCGIEGNVPNEHTKSTLNAHSKKMIPNFDWQLLVDTNSFKIVYIALPKTEKKDTSRRNLMVLDFVNTGNAIKYELTNTEEYFLLHLLTDSSSFDAGDCGTFELEGGFVVYKKEELAAYINLGCGYNQWVFHPANSFARPGSLNEQGFWKMQALLDNINKRKSEQP